MGEEFGKFITVRLQTESEIIPNCEGVIITFDYVLTTEDCNLGIHYVEFDTVKSHIRTHGNKVKSTQRERIEVGNTKVKRQRIRVKSIYQTNESGLIGIGLDRPFPTFTMDIETLKQAPLFLDSLPLSVVEDQLYRYHWKLTEKRRARFLHHAKVRREAVQVVRSLTGYLVTRSNGHSGSPILRTHNGMPILVGLTTFTGSMISIADSTEAIQHLMDRHEHAMWYDSTAEYITYVKGNQSNKYYHKWWVVNPSEQKRRQIAEEQRYQLSGKAENDSLARPITGIGYELEVLDAKHRYGSCLKKYYKVWESDRMVDDDVSFFAWFDFGEGRAVNIPGKCDRVKLERLRVKFCDKDERKQYEVEFRPVQDRNKTHLQLRYKTSGRVVVAPGRNLFNKYLYSHYIFTWDLTKAFYVYKKIPGHFHHSSFNRGEPVYAAGAIATTAQVSD